MRAVALVPGFVLGFVLGFPLLSRAPAAAQLSPIRDAPMQPTEWEPSRGDECYSRARGPDGVIAQDQICDGPRRVPVSRGDALERRERLGLGTRPAADRMRVGRAPEAWLAEIPSSPRDDLLWPVARGLFSRGFGRVRRAQINHRPHNGLDIVAEAGAHIRAANDGLVVYADNRVRGYGNLLILLHADGTATLYGHCRAIYVAPGQLVLRGQAVGEVGATGRPVIPHLHFEWRSRGTPRDPLPHLVERPPAATIRPDEDTPFAPPPPNASPIAAPSEVSSEARSSRLPDAAPPSAVGRLPLDDPEEMGELHPDPRAVVQVEAPVVIAPHAVAELLGERALDDPPTEGAGEEPAGIARFVPRRRADAELGRPSAADFTSTLLDLPALRAGGLAPASHRFVGHPSPPALGLAS